jgi:hypothetical protein
MSLTPEDIETLAEDFVIEYLERSPEYIDVVEYVSDNAPGDTPDEEINDTVLAVIYNAVLAHIDTTAQRFADRNN